MGRYISHDIHINMAMNISGDGISARWFIKGRSTGKSISNRSNVTAITPTTDVIVIYPTKDRTTWMSLSVLKGVHQNVF